MRAFRIEGFEVLRQLAHDATEPKLRLTVEEFAECGAWSLEVQLTPDEADALAWQLMRRAAARRLEVRPPTVG